MSWSVDKSDPECLIFIDEKPRSGEANMDLDRRALEFVCETSAANKHPQSICRLYRWNTPTVSLGYFQESGVAVPEGLDACPRVKRLTGGGAILHHHELTYSVALPAQHSIRHEPLNLYEVIHAAIIETLAEQGISSSLRKDSVLFQSTEGTETLSRSEEPFLCFLRQDDRDIVIGQEKVVGSAQRRRRGSILQHGSILLRASRLVPEMPGLEDLAPQFRLDLFLERLAPAIGHSISPAPQIQNSAGKTDKVDELLG